MKWICELLQSSDKDQLAEKGSDLTGSHSDCSLEGSPILNVSRRIETLWTFVESRNRKHDFNVTGGKNSFLTVWYHFEGGSVKLKVLPAVSGVLSESNAQELSSRRTGFGSAGTLHTTQPLDNA